MPLTTTNPDMRTGRKMPPSPTTRSPDFGALEKYAAQTGLDVATIQKVLDAFNSGGNEGFAKAADALSTPIVPGGQTAGGTAAQTAGPIYDKPKDFTAPGVNATSSGDSFNYTTKQGVQMNLTGAAAQAGRKRQNANVSNSPLSARNTVASPQVATPPPGNAFAGAPDARSGMRATPPPAPQPAPIPGSAVAIPSSGSPGGRSTPSFTSSSSVAGGDKQAAPVFQDRVSMALSALSQGNKWNSGVEMHYRDKMSRLLDQGEPSVGQLMQELSLTRAEAQRVVQALKGGVA